MTRKEAINSFSIHYCGSTNNCGGNNVKEIVNSIYDDFESRTCGSCKYLEETTRRNVKICTKLNTFYGESFGCNKFEKKRIKNGKF